MCLLLLEMEWMRMRNCSEVSKIRDLESSICSGTRCIYRGPVAFGLPVSVADV